MTYTDFVHELVIQLVRRLPPKNSLGRQFEARPLGQAALMQGAAYLARALDSVQRAARVPHPAKCLAVLLFSFCPGLLGHEGLELQARVSFFSQVLGLQGSLANALEEAVGDDLAEVGRVFALSPRSPTLARSIPSPFASRALVTAFRVVTLEPAELVEADGVGAEQDLGRLHGAEAEPALIEVDVAAQQAAKLPSLMSFSTWLHFASSNTSQGVSQTRSRQHTMRP